MKNERILAKLPKIYLEKHNEKPLNCLLLVL